MNTQFEKRLIRENHEIQLLTNNSQDENDFINCIKFLLSGEYERIINDEVLLKHLGLNYTDNEFLSIVYNSIEANVHDITTWFCIGIASLLHFVQCNFTGPIVDHDIDCLKIIRLEAIKSLSLHDECNPNVKKPELLYLSKIIFSNAHLQDTYKTCSWWLFRTNLVHQRVINETSGVIFEEMEELISYLNDQSFLKDPYCRTLLDLEVAQFYFYYKRTQNSQKHLERSLDMAQLTLKLEGALGKRTKYQHEEKAQLLLKVDVQKDLFPFKPCENLPKSLNLNDDVRLERIEYSEDKTIVQLGAMEEAIILAKHVELQLSQPKDKLTDEEIMPYLNFVIDNTSNWALKMTSLYHRSLLESMDKRAIERSVMQIEYLINEINNIMVPVVSRMDLFFASGMKPIWVLEELWANLLLNIGLVKAALDIFTKLQLHDNVITCYNMLELKHKAAEILRQEISKCPTVRLWCLLGDVTQDVNHYKTAWTISGEKSSRVQRHWGLYYFNKQNYDKAIPHLKKSVELNNIQENVWIRLGYAALQVEDWKLAVMAYKRYCALEQSTFEAWNNLAKGYIKLGDKSKAWRSLQDAIKCNYDCWQIWDNLMIVSTDLGHFSEVIRCYHRILDLKNQHLDIQILEILVNAIINNVNDAEGHSTRKFLTVTLELFGRITSCIPDNPDVWKLYAQLTALKKTTTDDQKAAQYAQRAYRAAVLNSKWFQQEDTTEKLLELCCFMAEVSLKYCSHEEVKDRKTILTSAKLPLQGVIRKVKDQEWKKPKIIENLEKLEYYLNILVNDLGNIK
ncbi:hypothetical protein KM043_007944 [Ampulex compressa]|nr:hypothetical protein KM043_007944 [Ampulex compressa]